MIRLLFTTFKILVVGIPAFLLAMILSLIVTPLYAITVSGFRLASWAAGQDIEALDKLDDNDLAMEQIEQTEQRH